MPLRSALLLLGGAFATAAIAGCSGTSTPFLGGDGDSGADGPDASTVTLDKAATDAANAYCARAQACAPAYVTIAYGTVKACSDAFKAELVRGFGGTGVNATPDWVAGCAAVIPQVSCGDLLARKLVGACKPVPGQLEDGAACANDGQCKATRCRVGLNQVCGTCAPRGAAGAGCAVDEDCVNGATCLAKLCVAYVDEGAACDAARPCRPDLACTGGLCGAPGAAGVACTDATQCNPPAGVACEPTTKKCASFTFAENAAPCGVVGAGIVQCSGGSQCIGISPPKYQGTCSSLAALGAACDMAAGPTCPPGAVCACARSADGGCAGTCKVKDPAACH